jgi:hypothetical protein
VIRAVNLPPDERVRYTAIMLMVIFGAGASYDSAQAYRPKAIPPEWWRPPLAKELFLDRDKQLGEVVKRYPKLTHILPYLREPSSGSSVEQVLESLQDEGKDDPESQREMASVRFYLCELLTKITVEWTSKTNGVTNYAPLVKDILRFNNSRERVCLVTFNYDLLLERALYTFDFQRMAPGQHLDAHPILKLFKLHGSVDWSRLVSLPEGTRLTPQQLIERADTIRVSDDFVLANATEPYDMHRFGRPLFPAIAIPVQTKSEQYFECPIPHRDYLAKMLPDITKILIVGWQAKEAHFLQMLQFKLPNLSHVMVVGANGPDAEVTLKYFGENIGLHVPNRVVGQGGFTDFVVNREGHGFFKA